MSEPVASLEPRPHVLYRMYDAARRLLYVGITMNVAGRMAEHRGEKHWWSDIATIELQHFTSRKAVERAEREAIRAERPAFNVMHVPTEREPGTGSRRTTPLRTTQIDDGPWAAFGRACDEIGASRAGVMRDLVLWFIRWPGAKLPRRPAAVTRATPEA